MAHTIVPPVGSEDCGNLGAGEGGRAQQSGGHGDELRAVVVGVLYDDGDHLLGR
jgi:hypothetical protein